MSMLFIVGAMVQNLNSQIFVVENIFDDQKRKRRE